MNKILCEKQATAAIQAARVPLVERLQKAKADGVREPGAVVGLR